MQDPFGAKEGRIDVARVMAGVRDAIRRRRDEASTSVEEAVALRLRDLADESGIDPELLAHLLAADGRWNLSPDYRVQTHRKGLEGRLVVFLKRLVRPIVRLYTDPIVERQAQVNLYLLHLARTLLAEVTRLERERAALGAPRDRTGSPREPDEPA
jgi:hypothetical protein